MARTGDTEGRLALDDGDKRPPWLESVDDDHDDEGVDLSRVGRFLTIAVLVLTAIGGGAWYVAHRLSAPPAGDGSIIAAPDTPYKVRPDDPGGKSFAASGDTSYAVGEGFDRRSRLAERPTIALPSPSASSSSPVAAAAVGVPVQVGAYSTEAEARAGWQFLTANYEPLSGHSHRIVEGRADIGTVYRLQAIAGDVDAARDLCRRLRASGLECRVKR